MQARLLLVLFGESGRECQFVVSIVKRKVPWLTCNYFLRMTSCCVTTTKALAKTSLVTRVHLSSGIERKSSGFLRALEFCFLSHRHFYCSVSCAIIFQLQRHHYRFHSPSAAPCIVCCKCKIEETTTTASKLDVVQMEDVRRTDLPVWIDLYFWSNLAS